SWVEGVFPRMPPRTPAEIFDRDLERWRDVCHPVRVNWELFGLGAVHYACAGKLNLVEDPQVQAKLQAFALQEYDDVRLPNPSLIIANDLATNNIASFLGGDPIQKLVDVIGVTTGTTVDAMRAHFGMEALLARLDDEARQDQTWLFFSNALRTFPVPEHLRSKLKNVLLRTDFAGMVKSDHRVGLVAICEASAQSLNLQDDEVAARLTGAVEAVAEILGQRYDTPGSEREALMLIEAALNVSLHLSPPSRGVAAFTVLARRIIDRWPQVAGWIAPQIATFQRELPTTLASALWPLLVRIRGGV
ncbi:MAG: hypothetical protein K2Q23_13115, partial [Bryobacteraceae bacterium]|nr:hypothetical protein [Bryobacteraceae bacterium]